MSMKRQARSLTPTGEQPSFLKNIDEKMPPGTVTSGLTELPDVEYQVDHVYGFSCHRNQSLHFGKDSNEIVFMTAALGVVQDLNTRQQKYFGGKQKTKHQLKHEKNWPVHQDEITAIDVCQGANRHSVIATCDGGPKAMVHVWDSKTMKSMCSFSLGASAKGISCLRLSPCARYVACVDGSNDHLMTIYNIARKQLLLQTSAGTDPFYDIQWSKKENDLRFSAVTARAMQLWHPADATKKLFKNIWNTSHSQAQTKFLCTAWDEEGICYSGGADGNIYCWDERDPLGLVLKAHFGECTAITSSENWLVSGGKDCMITVHSNNKGQFEFIR